jgi:hypothetical protein
MKTDWHLGFDRPLFRFLRREESPPARRCSAFDPLAMQDGDCLLCLRGPTMDPTDRIIEIISGGPWHHAAMAYQEKTGREKTGAEAYRLCVVEQVQSGGGRKLPFDEWVRDRKDLIDVYRPDATHMRGFRARGAVEWMLANIPGKPYDWESIHRFARQESWLTCWWNVPCYAEDAPLPERFVCSTAVAAACKVGGGVHPVSRLWVGDTTPTHLARCRLLDYQFTIPGGAVKP